MTTNTFAYTGGWQTFTVPANVKSLAVTLTGAGSGHQPGGKITGTLAVTPGQVLYLVVGGVGKAAVGSTGGAGGWGAGGAGGNGRGENGGDGGGGYSAIRLGGTQGKVLCVAGGAGGNSGDTGPGGRGGGVIGGTGGKGTTGSGTSVTAATGGTQYAPGHYGEYTGGSQNTKGTSGSTTILGTAGHGGNPGSFNGPGGGGGGGGYYPGGGGGGGSTGWGAGGAGGGGSNYSGTLTGANSTQGTGFFTDGSITLTYTAAPPPREPNNPSVTAPTEDQRTQTNLVTVKADVGASYSTNLRLIMNVFAQNADGSYRTVVLGHLSAASVAVTATGGTKPIETQLSLAGATRYQINVWAIDSSGVKSGHYSVVHFFSNYPPDPPTLTTPADNSTFAYTSPITFGWSHNDPDGQAQNGAGISFKPVVGGDWSTNTVPGVTAVFTAPSSRFTANTFWQWRVRTADPTGLWSDWSVPRSFYINGAPTPPLPTFPVNQAGVDVTSPVTFTWRFRDPILNNYQVKADFRVRRYGDTNDADWRVTLGDGTTPGTAGSWTFPADFLADGFAYEWQVRTYDHVDGGVTPSAWSASGIFNGIARPGRDAGPIVPATENFAGTLGCGTYRVFAAAQGGTHLTGELTGVTSLSYGRTRDDISTATIRIATQGNKLVCQLVEQLRTWRNELVFYRDDGTGSMSRPWEGPITRIEKGPGYVEIEARDVMAYVYRRIMKQGYDDAYPRNQSIVFRSSRIIIDALSRGDPNVLRYLTAIQYSDDALESRVVPDYATTAWEEVDDMAAKAGLDYTTVGRRIVLFDTHRSIGKLPVMRNGDFSSDLIITEYGMNLATEYAVTNGAGVWGTATRPDAAYGGPIELLVSAYGDTAAAADVTLTPAAQQALEASLNSQAERGIADRWPSPLVVRLPDSSTVNPDTTVTLDMLVPGVWIPLQASHECGGFSQWQKLDSISVTADASGEKVAVVMSPAPNSGDDPDANDVTGG